MTTGEGIFFPFCFDLFAGSYWFSSCVSFVSKHIIQSDTGLDWWFSDCIPEMHGASAG